MPSKRQIAFMLPCIVPPQVGRFGPTSVLFDQSIAPQPTVQKPNGPHQPKPRTMWGECPRHDRRPGFKPAPPPSCFLIREPCKGDTTARPLATEAGASSPLRRTAGCHRFQPVDSRHFQTSSSLSISPPPGRTMPLRPRSGRAVVARPKAHREAVAEGSGESPPRSGFL